MKRKIAVILSLALLASTFTGCSAKQEDNTSSQPEQNNPSQSEQKIGQAENDIKTYVPTDSDKTVIFVETTNSELRPFENVNTKFMEANPDIQVIVNNKTGGNAAYRPEAENILHGDAPDILFTAEGYFTDEETIQCFENLSDNPVIQQYEAEALNRVAVDDNIYMLPGPSSITCMQYNHALFQQYGWELPTSFDEFLDLCVKIKEDTNGTVQAWNPNAKYNGNFTIATTALCYDELFAGVDNRTWYNKFCVGEETLAGHMEPYYDMLQRLIDAGVFTEEYFSYSATTRGKEFKEGKIAFYNHPVEAVDTESDIRYIPFPSTTGGKGYVVDNISIVTGVPKKEHTEAEKEAIQKYLEYISSPEGQNEYISERVMFSNVKNVPFVNAESIPDIAEAIEEGRYFGHLSFAQGERKGNLDFSKDALAMLLGEKTGEQCIADNDLHPFKEEGAVQMNPLVTLEKDFTVLETSYLMADIYREKADADVGLIANDIPYRGNMINLYKGTLAAEQLSAIKPRSFDNGSTLVKVSMTGADLLEAINHVVSYENVNADGIYALSGLKCEVAPWNPMGEKYLSVTLSDGTGIDPEKTYTVAMWDGSIDAQYITEVIETYEGTWEELMAEGLKEKGAISPAEDGRITLVWK